MFHPDNGGSKHLWNITQFLLDYTTRCNISEDSHPHYIYFKLNIHTQFQFSRQMVPILSCKTGQHAYVDVLNNKTNYSCLFVQEIESNFNNGDIPFLHQNYKIWHSIQYILLNMTLINCYSHIRLLLMTHHPSSML
jgi:hypothetical protein